MSVPDICSLAYSMASIYNQHLPLAKVKLEVPSDWNAWFSRFRRHAHLFELWSLVNPDEEDQPSDKPTKPKLPTLEQVVDLLPTYQKWYSDLKPMELYSLLANEFAVHYMDYATFESSKQALIHWIGSTIEPNLYSVILTHLEEKYPDGYSLRQLSREIKREFVPGAPSIREETRRAYRGKANRPRGKK